MKFVAAFAGLTGALAVGAAAWPSAAQTITDPAAPPATATADGSGWQAPRTLTYGAAYTADALANAQGGARPGEAYVDLLKLSAAYDGAASGHDGLTGLLSLEYHNGANFSAGRVGAFQTITSTDAQPGDIRLYEAWIQREVLGGKGGVRAGLIDLNRLYDVQETASLFLNASHGIGPDFSDSGVNGPSIYPTTALAVTGLYRPAEGWTAQLGVFDAVAGDPAHRGRFVAIELSARQGALIVAQVEKRFGDRLRIEGGGWTYTAAFPSLDQADAAGAPRRVHGNDGVYGLVEGRILAKPGGGAGGLSGWLRLGRGNGDINPVEGYLGAGLVYTGLFPGRDADQAGVAVARAAFGQGARAAGDLAGKPIGDAETNVEATYLYVFRNWLSLQPDLQYVIHPGGDERLRNALVVGFRLAFTASR